MAAPSIHRSSRFRSPRSASSGNDRTAPTSTSWSAVLPTRENFLGIFAIRVVTALPAVRTAVRTSRSDVVTAAGHQDLGNHVDAFVIGHPVTTDTEGLGS